MTRRSSTPITERGCDVACCCYYDHSHPGQLLKQQGSTSSSFPLGHVHIIELHQYSNRPADLPTIDLKNRSLKRRLRRLSQGRCLELQSRHRVSLSIRISIETAHHDRGAGSLEAYRGHGLLAKVCFDTTNRLPFPNLSLRCSIKNRDVVFVLLSAFSRGRLELARQNLLLSRIRASGENKKDFLPSPPATPPDFRQALRRRQTDTFGAI
jgi:hypothetical protein